MFTCDIAVSLSVDFLFVYPQPYSSNSKNRQFGIDLIAERREERKAIQKQDVREIKGLTLRCYDAWQNYIYDDFCASMKIDCP